MLLVAYILWVRQRLEATAREYASNYNHNHTGVPMTNHTDVQHYWNIEWENVPAADLAETLGAAVMSFCIDDEGWLNHENVGDMIHHLVTRRNVLKECDHCSRLVGMEEQYCGDGECMEDE